MAVWMIALQLTTKRGRASDGTRPQATEEWTAQGKEKGTNAHSESFSDTGNFGFSETQPIIAFSIPDLIPLNVD